MSFLKLLASEANRALVRSESSFATSNLSIVEIRNYAILAGAFIFHSEKELGGTDMDHQLENTAKSVMKELQTYFETDPTPAGFDTPSESSEPNSGAVATTTTEPSVPGAFQDFKLKLMIKTGDNNIPIEDSLREANHLVLVHSLKLMLQVLIIPPVEVKLPAADARVPSPANAPETTRGTEMVVMRTLQFNITDTKKATATKQAPFNSYKKKPEGLVPVNITDGQSYYGKLQRNFKEAVVDAVQRGLHKVSPLRGWKPDAMGSLPWIDPRSCLFCGGVENDVFYGRFVPCGDMLFAHVNCIRWSDEVIENCGVLCSAPVAVRRSRIANCYLCSQKGATVGCRIKGCKRTFHLKCGVAVGGRLIELKHANDDDGEEHLVFARYECPEHIHGGYRHQARGHYSSMTMAADGSLSLNNKRPSEMVCIERSSEGLYEPYRRLKTDDLQIPDSELVAHEVSLKNHAGRLGAMVVHSLGSICTQKPEGGIDLSHLFYNERQIFPHKFRSSRIFWSTRVALTRTLYVFEVLSEHDLQETAGYIANTGMSSQITSEKRPVFRVTIMNDGVDDNTHEVIHGASVEDVYADIISRVEACTLSALPHLNKRKVSRSFGLNAYQFFGLGVPFVRRAIEDLPFSIAAVVANAAPQYRPCYNLYSAADYVKFEQLSGEVMHHNSSGCARAQGLEVVLVDGKRVRRGARITKILAKTVDDPEADGAAATEAMDEEQSDENRRNIERSRLRYLELAAEYKLNPGSKLQVRRSSIHGWGLFAKTKFYKHDMIVEYIGQKVRAVVADKREVMYEDEGVGSCYLFRLDKDAIVDATRTGGMARFINHCCEPNAYARIISAGSNVSFEDDADKHIVIFANRDIEVSC
jgi:histone-lysine N-methyltransferase SETD1